MQPTMSIATGARESPKAIAVMGRPPTDVPSFTVSAAGRGPAVVTDALAATVEDAPCPQPASAMIAIATVAASASERRRWERGLTPWRRIDAQRESETVDAPGMMRMQPRAAPYSAPAARGCPGQ
jgi:hypothetical protein